MPEWPQLACHWTSSQRSPMTGGWRIMAWVGPRWAGNVLDPGPGGGFLGKYTCENPSKSTLEIYALYVRYTTYLVRLSLALWNYEWMSERDRSDRGGPERGRSLRECFRTVVSVWGVTWRKGEDIPHREVTRCSQIVQDRVPKPIKTPQAYKGNGRLKGGRSGQTLSTEQTANSSYDLRMLVA